MLVMTTGEAQRSELARWQVVIGRRRCMEALGMWEDVLNIVDDETGNDESRLFLQDETWDGSQYIRSAFHHALHQNPCFIQHSLQPSSCFMHHYLLGPAAAANPNHKMVDMLPKVMNFDLG